MTHARSRQRLDRPGSDAADADDAQAQPRQHGGALAAPDTGETTERIGVEAGGSVWHVYILRCADRSLYTGITTDLSRRLQEHNAGRRGAAYTRARRPVTLVWHADAPDRASATRREWQIKRLTRRAKQELVALQIETAPRP